MKLSIRIFYIVVFFATVSLTSCGVNSNLMFKEPKGVVNVDSIPLSPKEEYRISPNDKLIFTLSTNNGTEILEKQAGISESNASNQGGVQYLVRQNGEIEIPLIGEVVVEGLTVVECEDTLAKLYSSEYKDPFVQVNVTNKRVIVFPGNGSDATVIKLEHSNTTLMEALALAGGITVRGKAKAIKVMRKVDGVREVYTVDLSTIDGLKYADMVVQANDYIYVEPTAELAKEIGEDVVPVVSLISSAIFIISAINLLK